VNTDRHFDVVIIGAGVVGVMTARELSRYRLSVAVLEKETDVGEGSSASNSAIIHSGHDPFPGTAKARMNVLGNALWHELAPELDIPLKKTGALIVAASGQEQQLEKLFARGTENGVPGLRILSRQETLQKEPLLNPDTAGALWTPTAAVVDPFEGVLGPAENAAENGVTFLFETQVTGAILDGTTVTGVQTSNGAIYAKWVVNAAGVYSDDIMHLFGDHPDFSVSVRRGEYFVFDPSRFRIDNVLFPMPDENGKGILVTTTTHGNAMIGPNSEEVTDKEDQSVTESGMHQILDGAARLIPSISSQDLIAAFAGLRATGNHYPDGHRDFLIERSATVKGLINLAGIESPGYASSPAIAQRVSELLAEGGLDLEPKSDWISTRKRPVRFHALSHEQRADAIRENPGYGRIVCRCEEVTEAEIITAIHRPIPARTYDAIKRRTWLGTGRCQGSFDYPRTMEILAQELGVSMTEVTKKGPGSVFLYRRTKEML